MPVEAKALFRADVLRRFLAAFILQEWVAAQRRALLRRAELFSAGLGDSVKEQQLLPDFEKGDCPFVRDGLSPFSIPELKLDRINPSNPLPGCACVNFQLGFDTWL